MLSKEMAFLARPIYYIYTQLIYTFEIEIRNYITPLTFLLILDKTDLSSPQMIGWNKICKNLSCILVENIKETH